MWVRVRSPRDVEIADADGDSNEEEGEEEVDKEEGAVDAVDAEE